MHDLNRHTVILIHLFYIIAKCHQPDLALESAAWLALAPFTHSYDEAAGFNSS